MRRARAESGERRERAKQNLSNPHSDLQAYALRAELEASAFLPGGGFGEEANIVPQQTLGEDFNRYHTVLEIHLLADSGSEEWIDR